MQADPTTASLTQVNGIAHLNGSVQMTFTAGSYTLGQQYTILQSSNPVAGVFQGISSNGFLMTLHYDVDPQKVIVTLNAAALAASAGLKQNHQNAAGTIDNIFNNGGALPGSFASIFSLTGDSLAHALSQLSGEAATGAQQGAFQLGSQFLNLMLDPSADGRGGSAGGPALGFAPDRDALPEEVALAYAKITKAPVHKAAPNAGPLAFEPRWSAWGSAYGATNKTDGDSVIGSHDFTARTAGFAAGMDYRVTPGTLVGFALAGGGTSWNLAQGIGGGKSTAFQAGVYATTHAGPAYVAASFAFSNHWMSTDRSAPLGNRATAAFDAQSFGGRLEGGWRFDTPGAGVIPYAAVQAQSFHTPGYSETDGGGFGLTYNSRTTHNIRSELGARFEHVALVNADAVMTLHGRLAWAHDRASDPSLTAIFQTLPDASFIVNGALPATDSALASAGAELRLANGVTLLAKFDGEFAERAQTYAGTGTLRVNW